MLKLLIMNNEMGELYGKNFIFFCIIYFNLFSWLVIEPSIYPFQFFLILLTIFFSSNCLLSVFLSSYSSFYIFTHLLYSHNPHSHLTNCLLKPIILSEINVFLFIKLSLYLNDYLVLNYLTISFHLTIYFLII